MTIKELYEWAVRERCEDYSIVVIKEVQAQSNTITPQFPSPETITKVAGDMIIL